MASKPAPKQNDKNASTAAKGGSTAAKDPMGARPKHIAEEDVEAPKDDREFFPKLKVLQAISPECTPGEEKFIPAARQGMLLITSDAVPRLLDGSEGINVVILECLKRYVEYVPRAKGGGFVASYNSREEMEASFTKGNDMQTTIDYLCVEADTMHDEEPVLFVISLDTVSKMAVARKIAGYVDLYKTLSGVKYHVTASLQKGKKGTYYNYEITPAGWLDKADYQLVLEHQEANKQKFLPEGTASDSEI